MSNKKVLFYVIAAVLISVLVLFVKIFTENQFKRNLKESPDTADFGTIEVVEEETTIVHEDDYVPTPDDVMGEYTIYTYFTNLSLVYDYLTLEATANIADAAAEYLNNNGYGHIHELTIIPETIIPEMGYPMFKCEMEDVSDKILEIRYDLMEQEFEFQLLNK